MSAVLVLTVLCYEIYSLSTPKVKTQTAIAATHKDSISTKMFAVRDESLISGSSVSGTLVSVVDDGERVAGGQAIAAAFANDAAAADYVELERLKDELKRYENLNSQQNLMTLDVSKINSDADLLFYDMLDTVRSGELGALNDAAERFSDKLTAKQILVNGNIDFSEQIASLTSRIQNLKSGVGNISYIKADDTGYYVSSADGYEGVLDVSKITQLKSSDVKAALSAKPASVSSDNIGKLIHGYNWYFVCVVSLSDALKLDTGDSVNLLCDNVSRGYISATVHHKGEEENGEVVFSFCFEYNG